jgi:hypothetical protein
MSGGGLEAVQKEIDADFGASNTLAVIFEKGDYTAERALIERLSANDKIDGVQGIAAIEFEAAPGYSLKLIDTLSVTEAIVLFANVFGVNAPTAAAYANGIFTAVLGHAPDAANTGDKVMLLSILEAIGQIESLAPLLPPTLSQLIALRPTFESGHYGRIILNLGVAKEGEQTFDLIQSIESDVGEFFDVYYLAGESAVNLEMRDSFYSDNLKITLITIGFILLILLLTFRNGILPFLLMAAIEGGILINFALFALTGSSVIFLGYMIISAMQMGATIDYAIILTNRYRGLKRERGGGVETMSDAINEVFPTILTSGSILTLAGFTLTFFSTSITSAIGLLLGVGTFASMLMALFFLPPLLLVSERLTDKAQLKLGKKKLEIKESDAT